MFIIGLSGDYIKHDSSLCLIKNGKVVYASSEERFSRLKNDPRAPLGVLEDVLLRYDLTLNDIDFIAVGMPPFKIMKGVFDKGWQYLPRILFPLIKNNFGPFFKYIVDRFLDAKNKHSGFEWIPKEKVKYISHYRAHAASAYRTSGFINALCVTMDAAGADEYGRPLSGSVFMCKNGEMSLLEHIHRFSSIGCFYNAVTQAIAFRPVGEDWKLMGLAAFGDPNTCYDEISRIAPLFVNGRWTSNQYVVESKLIDRPVFLRQTKLWKELSKLVDRFGDKDVAAATQKVFEDSLLGYFNYILSKYNTKNLTLAGGVFHNIKFCMRLKDTFPDINIYTHPASGDAGTSIGAALELYHSLTGESACKELKSMALGNEFRENEMLGELTKYSEDLVWERPASIFQAVAEQVAAQKVVGLFQGRSEWGPRALGQRSVIADPRKEKMRDRINLVLKNREWFMPFAPSIIEEDGPKYLEGFYYAPFMTTGFRVTKEARRDFPSAIHFDGTARPQIVRKNILPDYHEIIAQFKQITGVGAVLNTSFNRHGLPIVNSPKDGIEHLLWGCIDILALGPFVVWRKGKPLLFKKRIHWSVDEIIKKWEPFDDRLMSIKEKRKLNFQIENNGYSKKSK